MLRNYKNKFHQTLATSAHTVTVTMTTNRKYFTNMWTTWKSAQINLRPGSHQCTSVVMIYMNKNNSAIVFSMITDHNGLGR